MHGVQALTPNASEWAWPIKMPSQDHLLVKRPPGWVEFGTGGGGGGRGEDGERQLCNWLTLEGLAQVQIARPLCCKLQTFVSPQVECFFQTLSLLHIWVQFSACPLSENQFLLLSSALFLQLCEQTRVKGLHCPSPDPSKTTNGSYQLTPPCHPGGRGRKTGQAAPVRMCFLGSVCQSWQLFSHLKPELFTRALGECVRSTGGWEERRGESCCFSTSASNQSPEITAMVYGLWSWLLFRTTRERVGWGKGRGSREKGDSQGPEGVEVRGERLGGIGPFGLSKHVLI